jgi:transposase-like protein
MEAFMDSGKLKRGYRKWSMEEKRAAVARMEICTLGPLAEELGIHLRLLHRWREEFRVLDRKAKREGGRERALERENRELKQALATKVLEADFLQGVLRRIEARRQPISGSGETASTSRSK